MQDNVFSRVKAAVPAAAEAILTEHGIKHHRDAGQLKGEWTTGFLCPFCGDKSGSASFTHELYLRCHQCSYKADVFDWLAKHLGKKPWDVCELLGERLKVDTKRKGLKLKTRSMPIRMTEEILSHAIRDLWEQADAESARAVLAERRLDDQRTLMELEVGYLKGWIIFCSRDSSGRLLDRYRGWAPKDPQVKWRWFGQGSGGPGIWPCIPCPPEAKVWLCEGESDVLTAMIRLRLQDHGWHVATWTAGATSCPQPKDIPQSFHGKEVHVAYDNDVFQGPNYLDYVVITKPGKSPDHAREAASHRLRNLLVKVCPMLIGLKCRVVVRQCPVDPAENYGGDMRDWVAAGGRDLEEWRSYEFDSLPELTRKAEPIDFDEAFETLHKPVKLLTQVDLIGRDDLVLPRLLRMECELGQHPACNQCPGYRDFPDGSISMDEYHRHRAVGLDSGDLSEYVAKHVVRKPKNCPRLEIVTVKAVTGSEWQGIRPGRSDTSSAQRWLRIISEEQPSLSGEVEVTGTVYGDHRGRGAIMYAEQVTSLDRTEIDLQPFSHDFRTAMPCFSDDIAHIDEFISRRWRDLAYNVTRIHGREDIQIAHDLLAHSAIEFVVDGATQRGWLDICVFGETRSGKSLTFRRMFEHHGLGLYHTAVSNVSRAGLIMGADRQGLMKPGLMPKCNRKMLFLDEWHFLCQNAMRGGDHPMTWMQSARDEGKVSGVKIYGNRDLPAKVRFCTVANWLRNKRRTFEHPCEHVGALYGSPETVSRLDFALAVGVDVSQDQLDSEEHFWTPERTRALILRAWAQERNQVLIRPEAVTMARKLCSDWKDLLDSETLPLFTPEEKPFSLLRIAIAVANLTFSHPKSDIYAVDVRAVHVEWAAKWLQHVWKESGYDVYSARRMAQQNIDRPFEAEKMLSVALGLEDPIIADNTLSQFLEPFTLLDLVAITGRESYEAVKWISRMQALRVFERQKSQQNAYGVTFCTTVGGDHMLKNMLAFARNDHTQWVDRYRSLANWYGSTSAEGPGGLVSMSEETWKILGDSHGQALPF